MIPGLSQITDAINRCIGHKLFIFDKEENPREKERIGTTKDNRNKAYNLYLGKSSSVDPPEFPKRRLWSPFGRPQPYNLFLGNSSPVDPPEILKRRFWAPVCGEPERVFIMFRRKDTNSTLFVYVPKSTTIHNIKKRVEDSFNTSPDDQILYTDQLALDDDSKTLADYGLSSLSTKLDSTVTIDVSFRQKNGEFDP